MPLFKYNYRYMSEGIDDIIKRLQPVMSCIRSMGLKIYHADFYQTRTIRITETYLMV